MFLRRAISENPFSSSCTERPKASKRRIFRIYILHTKSISIDSPEQRLYPLLSSTVHFTHLSSRRPNSHLRIPDSSETPSVREHKNFPPCRGSLGSSYGRLDGCKSREGSPRGLAGQEAAEGRKQGRRADRRLREGGIRGGVGRVA